MTTLIVKNKSSKANQFLEFARTLSYVEIVENTTFTKPRLKASVVANLKKSEKGQDLVVCKDAEDMFRKLGI